MSTGLADEGSDYDLYAYTRDAVPVAFRARLLKPRAARKLGALHCRSPGPCAPPT